MFLDTVLLVFPLSFLSCKSCKTYITGVTLVKTKQLPDDDWKKQPKHVGELYMTFKMFLTK